MNGSHRPIDRRRGGRIDRRTANISDHPHDRGPSKRRRRRPVDPESPPNRILVRPKPSGHHLVDHGHGRRVPCIAVADETPSRKRHLHRSKNARRDDPIVCACRWCPLGIRPILDMKAPGERGCRQWKHVHRTDGRDVGQSLQPRDQACQHRWTFARLIRQQVVLRGIFSVEVQLTLRRVEVAPRACLGTVEAGHSRCLPDRTIAWSRARARDRLVCRRAIHNK